MGDLKSIAVTGASSFLGMFITEGMKRFPKATWYDRSNQANFHRRREADLGFDAVAAAATTQSLDHPAAVQVTVGFLEAGNRVHATVDGSTGKKSFSETLPDDDMTMDDVTAFIVAILDGVAASA